ncbi:hypothetical protein [Halobacillus massiliensis]|uniref:hypothetical protein n=1 Tax=Halobacillus massiliensis TaxID=1926286 RepID=UPI0009E2B1A1|nr:hypothetical protein [Halobacillus massiliensis]
MRYAERITLHESGQRQYNPETGKTEVTVDEGLTLPCHLSPTSLEKVQAVFGSTERKVTTARLQRPYKGKADKAVTSGNKFNVLRHVPHRSESVIYLEGVSEWT